MQVSENTVVTVTYVLHSNLPNTDKQHVETADQTNPLRFLYGAGMMIPGFEKGLSGKSTGDKFSFSIESADAYGEADETAVINLPIDIFKVDGIVDMNLLKIGNVLPMSDNQGNVLNGRVLGYDDANVKMDFNHPLAGHTLHFSGEIVEVREASAEEIDHGHVH
ncbi:MAG: FKBP-type peptidyl-prolyl cis-trans isomerase [Bacteroidetes bacterium]|nr:FKBP-type peptidyl-prolyl cis-trans isomerase [Bacteroidota bacterium]